MVEDMAEDMEDTVEVMVEVMVADTPNKCRSVLFFHYNLRSKMDFIRKMHWITMTVVSSFRIWFGRIWSLEFPINWKTNNQFIRSELQNNVSEIVYPTSY